jgi:type VI secretion system Hcp family effector
MEASDHISFKKWAIGLLLMLVTSNIFCSLSSAADIDVFANIEGLQCQGMSTASRFPGAIVVRSLSGGTSNSSVVGTGGGGGPGKPIPAPLKIAKDFDACSPLLFRAAVLGQHLNRVTISFVANNDNSPVFFEIQLTDALVQDITLGANDALNETAESVSFIFRRLKLTDRVILPTGAPGGQVVVECDFVQNLCN